MSAAHCFVESESVTNQIDNYQQYQIITNLRSISGSNYDLFSPNTIYNDVNLQTFKHYIFLPERITIHPSYNKRTKKFDAALIKLQHQIPFSHPAFHDKVLPVCIETNELQTGNLFDVCYQKYSDTGFWVTGWGKTQPNVDDSAADILQEVELPYVDPKSCKRMLKQNLGNKNLKISDEMLCAGGQEGKDSCRGDSGGPLVRRLSSNQWMLSGIVSFGYSCGGRNIPAIYTRVSSIAGWIYEASGGQVFSDIRINGDVFKPESQSNLIWDIKKGWGNVTCLGKSEKIVNDPSVYSFTSLRTNRKNRPVKFVPKNKKKFLPNEGANNFELEFEVKALKNAFIHLCRREKKRGGTTKRCFQFSLGALEFDNYVSYMKVQTTRGTSSVEVKKHTPLILDERNYNAFKLVYEQKSFKLYDLNDKIRSALRRQHRDESDFVTDDSFDIEYNDKPLLVYRLNGNEIDLNNINHVEFATQDTIGYWNLLIRNNPVRCYDGLCQNGGKCINGFNRYSCICAPGFEGHNCEWDFNDCKGVLCYTQDVSNVPECKDGWNNYNCECDDNWTGKLCDNPPNKGYVTSLPPDVLALGHYPENHVQNLTLSIPKIYGIRNTGLMVLFHTLDIDCGNETLEFVPIETVDESLVITDNLKTYRAQDDREIDVYGQNVCRSLGETSIGEDQISDAIFFQNVRSLQVTFKSPLYSTRVFNQLDYDEDHKIQTQRFKFQVFHMEETKCRCEHGKPVEDAKCREEGTQNCSECNEFYRLEPVTDTASIWYNTLLDDWAVVQKCVLNICQCDRGFPSKECPSHGESNCEACHSTGDTLNEERQCTSNECTCDNGIRDDGHDCEDDGFEDCSACNDFFHGEISIFKTSRWHGTASHYLANKQLCMQNTVCIIGLFIAFSP